MGSDPSAEEQFGPYVVYERLGVGGMATVHRALERGLDGFERIVALKRLLPHLAADASFIKSFVREAKLASLLNHGNIVRIFECGRVGAQYFISMEHIDGRDIRRILRHARKVSGPPPIHITVGLLLQLCEALDYAHRKTDESGHPLGLVHRDVSPSNVLVTLAGQVKVIDFGIAKAQSAQLRTQTGRVKGKLAYMSPETLAGKELDARSDLFAAGVIAHELLTARPLFATKNEYQTLMKVQRGDVMPPSTFNQSCPPELDAIVLRALAREPDDRFSSAAELRDELHAMRRQYNLQATERDVATWLSWAFSQAAPATRPSRPPSDSRPPERPSRPRRDDDDAVEIAWGSVDDHNNGEPVVLDDVPDVTDKHLGSASALGAEVRLDFDDLADDIPTPVPSHGPGGPGHGARPAEPRSRAIAASMLARPVARTRNPTPSLPPRGPTAVAAPAVPPAREPVAPPSPLRPDDPFSKTSLGMGVGPGFRAAMASRVPDTQPSLSPPPAAKVAPLSATLTPPGGVDAVPTTVRAPQGTLPPRLVAKPAAAANARAAGTSPLPRAETATVVDQALSFAALDGSSHHDSLTEPVPFHVDDLALASDTIPTMPAVRNSEPVVRFREPTTPPPMRSPATLATPPSPTTIPAPVAPMPSPVPSPLSPALSPAPSSRSAAGSAAPSAVAALSSSPIAMPAARSSRRSAALSAAATLPIVTDEDAARLTTPATELFSDPELDTVSDGPPSSVSDAFEQESESEQADAAPRRGHLWRILLLLLVLALAAVAAAVATGYMPLPTSQPVETRLPAPPPPRPLAGTVRLAVTPADATIMLEGRPARAGSIELPPGVYQIEIQREGHKGWLTSIEVVAGTVQNIDASLEPLGSAVVVDATLVVSSTPAGLEVVLDGTPLTDRTPIKLPLPLGPHTVVLRKDGAEVWRKALDARASAVYEYKPTIAEPGEPGEPAPDVQRPAESAEPAESVPPAGSPPTTDTTTPETAPAAPPTQPDEGSGTP